MKQAKQMDGVVQSDEGEVLWTAVQDSHEKGRGPPITERMEPAAVGRQLLLQLPALVITLHEAEEGVTTVGSRNRYGS